MKPKGQFFCCKRYSDIPFAHRQPRHDGHCKFIHGHNWDFEITFQSTTRDENGFIIDFGKLEDVKAFIETFDHALVIPSYDKQLQLLRGLARRQKIFRLVVVPDASSEGLAQYVGDKVNQIVKKLTENKVTVHSVIVYEDKKNSAKILMQEHSDPFSPL